MNIGLLAVDSTYPNLALMKISAYHKARGDNVEWYNSFCSYDKVYMAKVFSFTSDYNYFIQADQVEKGGTGYDISKNLPDDIDRTYPDYNLYGGGRKINCVMRYFPFKLIGRGSASAKGVHQHSRRA